MKGRRGLALLLALLVVVIGGAVLLGALVWARAELRGGRSWSDLVSAEAAAQGAMAEVLAEGALWDSLRVGESAPIRRPGPGPSDSTGALATRIGDSAGYVTALAWGPRASAGIGLLVYFTADSLTGTARTHALPWRDRAWISLIPP